MGKSGGLSVTCAILALAQRLGNYENKPLAIVLAVGAAAALLWFGTQLVREGASKLRAAKETRDSRSRNGVYGRFALALLFAAAIVIALVWRPSSSNPVAKSLPSPFAVPAEPQPPVSPTPIVAAEKKDAQATQRHTKQESPKTTPDRPALPVVNNAPGGIINSGSGTIQHAIVNNAPPEPKITWRALPGVKVGDETADQIVIVTVDRSMDVPAFIAECDKPCRTLEATIIGVMSISKIWWEGEDSNKLGILVRAPRPLGAGVEITWFVKSRDTTPARVLSVSKLPLSKMPAEYPRIPR